MSYFNKKNTSAIIADIFLRITYGDICSSPWRTGNTHNDFQKRIFALRVLLRKGFRADIKIASEEHIARKPQLRVLAVITKKTNIREHLLPYASINMRPY